MQVYYVYRYIKNNTIKYLTDMDYFFNYVGR